MIVRDTVEVFNTIRYMQETVDNLKRNKRKNRESFEDILHP